MTPEQARKLLEGTSPAPREADNEGPLESGIWYRTIFGSYFDREDMPQREQGEPEDTRLMAAAPDMAEMIANMTAEYAVIHQPSPGSEWHQVTRWSKSKNPLNKGYELADDERIVCRYVTAPQPLGEEQ